MRNNNEHQNSACEYAEQAAAYLYDEFDDDQKAGFETHLQNCGSCADELADFSILHSSIQDWKRTDFDHLPTPVFVMPNESKTFTVKSSWLDDVISFFRFSPAFLTSAAAVLVLALGIIWIIGNASKTNYVAQNNQPQAQNSNQPIQIAAEPNKGNQTTASDIQPQNLNGAKPDVLSTEIKHPQLKANPLVAKTPARKPVLIKSDKISAPTIAGVNNHKARTRDDVPSLNVGDEEEDSLRLSDLFEEVGMIKSDEVNNE